MSWGDRQEGFADKQPGIVCRTCHNRSGLVGTLILFDLSSSLQFSFLHFAVLKLFFFWAFLWFCIQRTKKF